MEGTEGAEALVDLEEGVVVAGGPVEVGKINQTIHGLLNHDRRVIFLDLNNKSPFQKNYRKGDFYQSMDQNPFLSSIFEFIYFICS